MTMKFTSTALILAALTTSTMVMAHDRDESYGMESATQLRVQALVAKHQQPIKLCSGTLNLATYSEVISSPLNMNR
ncbi:hypothetical protein EQ875_03709 [Photobacterium damselae subsp. damselae]|uniref:hypothetical protein n=1 Tax=Photobacterium damselae TaxID=38293 RepID=UPI00109B728A|nr:hypothetical protein [Photobacterium damselae]TGZ32934.1 hypothetical protein EQ875_03709 [Photobacterium damselae subsp. damselae]